MFVYLSKKIAMPNSVHLHCIGWSQEDGYIAAGVVCDFTTFYSNFSVISSFI